MFARRFTCPHCVESRVHPSRSRGWADAPYRLLLLRPWRCLRCYHRLWRPVWGRPAELDRRWVVSSGSYVELQVAPDSH